ncbi:anti-sigma B factor antagonist [Noviherbaspirillum humi]|uniref:Anti-sigma factor antagonist n=1 Tax=Noviherbaspirillum humi TaxID=1688639 RepID=A0A239DPJ0_9BURK|nr:STAS domain-containing protein [Noviherbaspirillum humi]SNS33663.1 anti-sigma B factor antagonist [Noviherbaspirillum humi]
MSMIDLSKEGEVAVARLQMKRLDAANALAFKEAMVERIQAGEQRLVLDMEGVDFVDSSGLGALVSVLKALGGKGAVVICNVRGNVQNLFKLTRMDKVFAILPSRDEAVQRARG